MMTATNTGTGIPTNRPKPNTWPNCDGIPYTGMPLVIYSAMPKPTDAMPNVIMKGDTLNTATPMPLVTPTSVPAAMPARQPSVIASHTLSGEAVETAAIAVAPTTEVNATMVPTDRSKPPVSSASI